MVTITDINVFRSEVREGSILNKPCSNTPINSYNNNSIKACGVISTSRFFETSPKRESFGYLLSKNRDCLFPPIRSVDSLDTTLWAIPTPGSLQERSLVDDQQNKHFHMNNCSYSMIDKKRTSNQINHYTGSYSFLVNSFPRSLVNIVQDFSCEYTSICWYIKLVLEHDHPGPYPFISDNIRFEIDIVIDNRFSFLDELLDKVPRFNNDGYNCNFIISQLEKRVQRNPCFHLELQSEEFRVFDMECWNEVFDSQIITGLLGKYDSVTKLIEDLACLAYGVSMCKTKTDIIFVCLNFMKLRCGSKSLIYTTSGYMEDIMCYITEIFANHEEPLTSDDDALEREILASLDLQVDFLETSRSFISMYKQLRFGPLFKRCQKLITYLIAFSVFKPLGYDLKSCGYTELEKQAIERKVWNSDEAIFHILETLQFICERGHACLTTGSIDALFHGGTSYDKFYMDCQKIKKWHPLIGHPDLMSDEKITEHSFLAALDSAIERGESIYKYAQSDKTDRKIVSDMLNAMCLIRSHHMTIKYALQDRKAPLSLLLFGDSGIGKTTLTNILFVHYGKRRGQPIGDEFKYVKNPVSKYWDNFRTNMWCLIQDDIGFKKPSIAMSGDETCMETIQINNNVAFTPDQASLDMKGKMPLRCELVIGTTNTENLNAYHYFACPSAFQRRYPYILDVSVKPEFKNEVNMLDANSTKNIDNSNTYPDYWLWTVKKVKPNSVRVTHQTLAQTEEVLVNVGLKDFLIWYNKVIDEHHADQKVTSESVENIRQVQLCQICNLPPNYCECSLQVEETSIVILACILFYWLFDSIKTSYCSFSPISSKYTHYFTLPYTWSWFYFKCAFIRVLPENVHTKLHKFNTWREMCYEYYIRKYPRKYWKSLGIRVCYSMSQPSTIFNIVLVVSTLLMMWKLTQKQKKIEKKVEKIDEVIIYDKQSELNVNLGSAPIARSEERNNPWYNDKYELHQMDMGNLSIGWNTMSLENIHKKLSLNCVALVLEVSSTIRRRTSAFCVGGQIYLVNSHFFKELKGDYAITVFSTPCKQSVNPNITIMIDVGTVLYKPDSDICLIELRGLPARSDYTDLFCKESFDAKFDGFYLKRELDGSLSAKSVKRIRFHTGLFDQHTQCNIDAWEGVTQSGCQVGDCGSILVVKTGYGPVILGIHYLGNPNINTVCSVRVNQEWIKQSVKHMNSLYIQDKSVVIDAPSVKVELLDLHKKSAFRFLDNGSAMVCGSLTIPRAHGSSRVENTPMNNYLSTKGYETKYTKPDLVSWRPWHLAAKEMVCPANLFKPSILKQCMESFSNDILSKIDLDTLQRELHVFDDFTAINGAAGVTYIDKINRNTSMGHPYNRSKRFYINPIAARGENLDPVEFTEEIKLAMIDIESNYRNGYRNNPIFRGNLKDEAVSELKAELGKTRLFAGAPVAWSIVNRKYTLSFIRLLQSNQYVFECACGIVCQSSEWDIMRQYLTYFGSDKLVAGDFSKFDKRMSAEVIQLAFDIIINVCRASGNYTEQDLLVVKGIGIDTAFSWMNFNGDLVSFFGTNPSGHPLTVIINSLVNSLYMRYCFTSLTGKHPSEFKKFVHLMTYGDDNIMNVSPQVPNFNHTSIQSCLKDVGIGYTMADKEADSIPYIHIDNCSFLKRVWRFDEDFGKFVAPLDHESIEKMLMTWVRSKTISEGEQCVAVISSAVMEYAFYGKLVFADRVGILKEMCKNLGLDFYVNESTFPTFEELINRYHCSGHRLRGAQTSVGSVKT